MTKKNHNLILVPKNPQDQSLGIGYCFSTNEEMVGGVEDGMCINNPSWHCTPHPIIPLRLYLAIILISAASGIIINPQGGGESNQRPLSQ